MIERVARLLDGNGLSFEQDLAAAPLVGSEDQPRELGAAGTDEARDPEHLALMKLEAARLHASAAVRDPLDFEDDRAAARMRIVLLLVEGRKVAPDHHLDDRVRADLALAERADIRAVAENRDAVGELVDLRHAMADVDNCDAVSPKFADEPEQALGFPRRQRRRRLVEHEDFGFRMQRASDFNELLLGDRKHSDGCFRRERRAEPFEHRPALRIHRLAIDQAAVMDLVAEIHVLRNAQVRGKGEFLIDDRNAMLLCGDRIGDVDMLPVDQDLGAGIGLVGTGEDLHQRRLAGAVLAHEGHEPRRPMP